MTKSSLDPGQRRTAQIIETLGFWFIEHLLIRGGLPCYDHEPRITQTVKLDSAPAQQPGHNHADRTLKQEFDTLFSQLSRLRDGTVDIEVRHGLPVKLVLERRFGEFL
jgi:hypothetical protein